MEKAVKSLRRKRIINVISALVICCAVAVIVKCVLEILPQYAQWQYENRISYLDVTPSQTPSFVTVQIVYANKAPTDIKIMCDEKDMSDRIIWDYDMNHNSIALSFDTEITAHNYRLQLLPQDNYELEYNITEAPSYSYMSGDIQAYSSETGERWLMIHASYPRTVDPFYVSLYFEGINYRPTVTGFIMNGDTLYLNIDKIVEEHHINLSNINEIQVYIGQEITDEDAINIIHVYTRQTDSLGRCYVRMDKTYNINAWPEYDPEFNASYDLEHTEAFLNDEYNRPSVEELEEIDEVTETNETE